MTGGLLSFAVGLIEHFSGQSFRAVTYTIVGCAAFMVGAYLAWNEEHKKVLALQGKVTATDWKDLSSKFDKIPAQYARAEWYSESLDNDGKLAGERWMVRGEFGERYGSYCESLCQLAGAMLLKSPHVSSGLSQKVKSRSNEVWRWLYFLREKPGTAKTSATGQSIVRGFSVETRKEVIDSLPLECSKACLECAAREL